MPNHPRYEVVLLNDNETPIEFVVRVLEVFFDMSFAEACTLMLRAHAEGKAVCGHLLARGSKEKGNRHSGVCRRAQISAQVYS